MNVPVGHQIKLMFNVLCLPTDLMKVYDGPIALKLMEEYNSICDYGRNMLTKYFIAQIQHYYSGNTTVDRALEFQYKKNIIRVDTIELHGRHATISVVHNNRAHFQRIYTFSKPNVSGLDHQVNTIENIKDCSNGQNSHPIFKRTTMNMLLLS